METTSRNATHDLLLALAGRVDDDLLGWVRELVAVGEDAHAVEMLTASLAADRVALPPTVRGRLVELARAARIELDVDAALLPAAAEDATEHRFAAEESLAGPVATVLVTMPARQLEGCRVLLTHRRTAAGSAPGPLPHPVLVVEVEPGTRRPDMLAYQLAVALQRSGVICSVEVLTVGDTVPAYHAEALRSARQLRLDRRPPAPAEEHAPEERAPEPRTAEPRVVESTVAVPALPTRKRRGEQREPDAEPGSGGDRAAHRLNEVTQPISAAPPFGASNSDTPLFDSPTPTPPRSERDDRDDSAARVEAEEEAQRARLTAVPTLFDETHADDGDFRPEEFGRSRRAAHRATPPESGDPEPRPAPRPKPRVLPAPVTPINRTSLTGPTPIPLLRRGTNGRPPLSPVDRNGHDGTGEDDFDPLQDPLSRPLMPPLLDRTPPLTGPIGLVGATPDGRPSDDGRPTDESWSGDWLSGAWAMPSDGAPNGERPAAEPEREISPPRPIGRRSARHRYLRTPDEPVDTGPSGDSADDAPAEVDGPGSGAIPLPAADTGAHPAPPRSGAIPMPGAGTGSHPAAPPTNGAIPIPPASGPIPIPLPPATTGGMPQTPTRPAIPMPSGTSRDQEARPDEHPRQLPDERTDDRTVDIEVDPNLGLRPESLARLGEADLDLLAKLQAELRSGRVPRGDDRPPEPPPYRPVDGTGANGAVPRNGGPPGAGTAAHRIVHSNGHGPANGSRSNGSGPGDPAVNGTGANGAVTGTGRFGPERNGSNGSTRHGSRLNPFSSRRKRGTEPGPDEDTPPDAG
ncbi:hypothetical protein [Pseudonocardia humida]|uniref:Uncharacterized protein n=1 Tax=Pseudonocardia humida TaxID=2800819 RepID=A0ABT0ZX95_9PSEU|nr:hypothetical protein [Pseudonocardia humida]MCO1655341.1 hypothetical protein [Pseudonocardia humida]